MRLDHLLSQSNRSVSAEAETQRAQARRGFGRAQSSKKAQTSLFPTPFSFLICACMGMCSTPWGYSSVARAVALQAIGQGFKSPYLQSTCSLKSLGKGEGACFCRRPEIRSGSAQRRSARVDYRLSRVRHDQPWSFGTISEAVDPVERLTAFPLEGTAMQCPHTDA